MHFGWCGGCNSKIDAEEIEVGISNTFCAVFVIGKRLQISLENIFIKYVSAEVVKIYLLCLW